MSIFARMFCVIDIESTGGQYGKEAMMEIAAFRFDGEEVVDQLISLVHPHKDIQPFVSKMTGITPKMLLRAPRFHEIAKRLVQITEDAVIVGHNVDFDYRMLRQEFSRLGYQFERKTLDTISLTEKLIPGLKSYGLDAVCDELGIYRNNKHRAESDARATLQLFEILREKDRAKEISVVGQGIQQNDFFKDKMLDLQRSVKHNRGVFYIHNRDGNLLYLGASDNVKTALNRLFMADNAQVEKLRKETHSIRVEPCGNWLVARIKRMEELEESLPPFNNNKYADFSHGIYLDKRSKPPRFSIKSLKAAGSKKPVIKTVNAKLAQRSLRMYSRLRPEQQAQIVANLQQMPNRAYFSGRGRSGTEHCIFVVNEGKLIGYRYYKLQDDLSDYDRLQKNLVQVSHPELFYEFLKLGYISGEFSILHERT